MQVTGRHYRTGGVVRVRAEAGRIVSLETIDADAGSVPWLAPGLVDAQVNGFGGVDFNRPNLSPAEWAHACEALYAHGCTRFLAALITHAAEDYGGLLRGLAARRAEHGANCAGFHLEGPFLNPSPDTRGVHDPAWMRAADAGELAEWQRAAGGAVRVVTLAPEMEAAKACLFISKAVREGVRVAIGHSMAGAHEIEYAVDAGASAWTHLGNACARVMPRFDNPIVHAVAEDRLRVFVIPDGVHVPHYAVKVLAAALGARLLLTTDAMAGAGAGPGDYTIGRVVVSVGRDGVAREPDEGRLAGSTLTPFAGVFRAAELAHRPWAEMWDAFSTGVASWLGFEHGLAPGCAADVCLFETEPGPRLVEVWADGERRYGV
jgi:N-acetylglucosamine-6-phosphate deacetylase